MRKGDPVTGLEFFDLLYADKEFCQEFGRCQLEAARLEGKLITYLIQKRILKEPGKETLGNLIKLAKDHGLLDYMTPILTLLKNQRNYLTHNLYTFLMGLIKETVLPRSDLIDSDIDLFTDRVSQLREDFRGLGNILDTKYCK